MSPCREQFLTPTCYFRLLEVVLTTVEVLYPQAPSPLGTGSRISITTSTRSDTGGVAADASVAVGAGSNADPASGAKGNGGLGVSGAAQGTDELADGD